MTARKTDLAIIGGGLVGLCAALALQKTAQKISILEASDLQPDKGNGLNARSIALSYSSVQIFRALGIWSAIKNLAAPIETIHISSQGRWGMSRLNAVDYELEALGYVIESRLLTSCLLEKVQAFENIELLSSTQFESIESGDIVGVGYRHQNRKSRLNANLALIADGSSSSARTSLGIEHRIVDYGQSAIITNVEFDKPLPTIAYERFTDQGPLAMLPLGDNRYACVWTRDGETAELLMQADQQTFIEALQRCFGHRLGFIENIGERFSFELKRIQAEQLSLGRCLLIGNAANALHPVAGQSFNLALRDIAALYELFDGRALSELDNAAVNDLMQQYIQNRQSEQKMVAGLGDGLVSLFSNQLPLLGHLRAGSLALLEQFPALKAQVAMSGMGMAFGGNTMLRGRL